MNTPSTAHVSVAGSSILTDLLDHTAAQTVTEELRSSRFAVDASAVNDQNKAMQRIAQLVDFGRTKAAAVIERVQTEVPKDYVAKANVLRFSTGSGDAAQSVHLGLADRTGSRAIHPHALGQLGTIAGATFVPSLATRGTVADPWGAKDAVNVLNNVFSRTDDTQRQLIRSVNGQVRAVLSDSYRRLDSRPILDAILGAFQKVGLQPYNGQWLDTRMNIQAIVPQLYSPVAGELIAFGLNVRTSDYGDGAFDVQSFIMRPACANGMIGESVMRAVHLGKRLSEDLQLSQKTYDLDTQTMASAAYDAIVGSLSPEKINARLAAMRAAYDREVDPAKAMVALRKSMTKEEATAVASHFATPDVVTLSPGNNALRMSNAISWLANTTANPRRALELQEVAGDWIKVAA